MQYHVFPSICFRFSPPFPAVLSFLIISACDVHHRLYLMPSDKRKHALCNIEVVPYGSIGKVMNSKEEVAHMNSCLTNLLHCRLLQVMDGTSIPRGMLIFQVLGIFHKFAQRWLHWRKFINKPIDISILNADSSEFKGNSTLGLLLSSTLQESHWKSLGVSINADAVLGLSFTDLYETACSVESFCVADRPEIQKNLDASIDLHINASIKQVWLLTMEDSLDPTPSVSVSDFGRQLKKCCDAKFNDIFYHVGDGNNLTGLTTRIEQIFGVKTGSSRRIPNGFVGV